MYNNLIQLKKHTYLLIGATCLICNCGHGDKRNKMFFYRNKYQTHAIQN